MGVASLLCESPLWGRVSLKARVACVSAITLLPLVTVQLRFWELDPGAASRRIYPRNSFDLMPSVAREIASVTRPEDTVLVFGAEPELLFYARRRSATRYIHLFPLFGPHPDALARQRSVADEITRSRPSAIVWVPNRMFFGPEKPQYLTEWVEDLIHRQYRLHARAVGIPVVADG